MPTAGSHQRIRSLDSRTCLHTFGGRAFRGHSLAASDDRAWAFGAPPFSVRPERVVMPFVE